MATLNILICRTVNGIDCEGNPFVGNAVYVRNGYTSVDAAARFVGGTEYFDPDAINNLGDRGGYSVKSDDVGVAAAVASLRAEYGADLPVQDNSGKFPHLATVVGVGQF
jgi:hypothetical protein